MNDEGADSSQSSRLDMVLDNTFIEEESKRAASLESHPINVTKLTKIFQKKGKQFSAIDDISFILEKN